jgi:CheY-like chemotaxis protein
MNGHIWVSSETEKGSVFGFRIELEKSEKQAVPLPTLSTNDKHVVVVDDNESNLIVLGKQLRQWGVNVTTFSHPLEALDYFALENNPADAAILDLNMPEQDGATLCQRIRSIAHRKNVKMILMTSMSQRGDAQHYADVGFSGYFPKPATSADIIDALTILFDDGEALNTATPLVTQHYVRSLRQDLTLDQSYRVLLVEDNPVNQMISKKYILSLGLEATVSQDGQAALDLLKSQPETPFDLILMDCQMPVLDGFETTRKIRLGEAGEIHVNTPIIAMTANAMKGDREHCLEVGMDDYLSKPIRKDIFAKTIKNWLMRG